MEIVTADIHRLQSAFDHIGVAAAESAANIKAAFGSPAMMRLFPHGKRSKRALMRRLYPMRSRSVSGSRGLVALDLEAQHVDAQTFYAKADAYRGETD